MELNREILDCMKNLRRRLREELSVEIRLSQQDVVSAMLAACLTSSDRETRELGLRLAQLSDTPMAEELPTPRVDNGMPHASSSIRIYRGQRIYA
ncbi:hypothetical protein DNK06_10120 [Pseudomonas daroniae]|uniref:Uncharacterized protein n=1 Tax=Phytopseudomonas daroniae TaxID=2487519 RepID=A0A4Q9QNW8_9GAMM|nr:MULTISPECIES: hypothetical protein [Pseudomonas]TBU80835.1 hypothetical protein DNK06_10120 [Pseudomonas daroniae]TBU81870.1 hypothetical protein DNK31_14140 [Pseudomonas sp. FRB 228]TBU90859.1 hypothetical protein DNJ99_13030 [Pseudomonas daroniae]